LIALIDGESRCRHCFAALESAAYFCRQCAHAPILAAPHAYLFDPNHVALRLKYLLQASGSEGLRPLIASFLVVQFNRLNWPMPDRVAIILQRKGGQALREIAEQFAQMIGRAVSEEFKLRWSAPFEWRLERKKDDLLENQNILLIDFDSPVNDQCKALNELWPAFPKQIHILSIFPNKEL
jgi:hypothetical protein